MADLKLNIQKADGADAAAEGNNQNLTVTPSKNFVPIDDTGSPTTILKHVAQGGPSAKTKEIWEEIVNTQDQLHTCVNGLDQNLSKVLKKHEYEYMAAYNIQVKRKEQEILQAMEDLVSDQNAEIKDIKIQKLESSVAKLRRETHELEKAKEKLREEIKNWKKKYEYEQQEHEFYQKSAMASKRKNKLLKVAVGRLQFEFDKLSKKYKCTEDELKFVKQLHSQIERVTKQDGQEEDEDDAGTFMTRISEDGQGSQKGRNSTVNKSVNESLNKAIVLPDLQIKAPAIPESSKKLKGHATEDSFVSAGLKSVSSRNSNKNRFFSTKHNRANSNAVGTRANMTSRYAKGTIPTENLKFSQFLDILFTSGMTKSEIKNETQGYVQVLETNYTDKIRDLKIESERLHRQITQKKSTKVVAVQEKNDLEQLFVRCVEDMRKEIIRRRLKAEVTARKKMGVGSSAYATINQSATTMQKSTSQMSDQSNEGNRQFEETLGKLAEMAKGRVKFEEFTQVDRNNLLDLFVNNERTLLKIYELLFSQPSFNQQQILANPSDSIRLNDVSQKTFKLLDSSLFTQATGHDLSIDQTTDNAAPFNMQSSPNPYDMQNSSFALDDLNQDSQMVTERGEIQGSPALKQNPQLSGNLMLQTLNQQSTTLPNILPAMNQGVQSDARLIRNNPNQPPISFSP